MIIQATYRNGEYFHNPELYDDWLKASCVIKIGSFTSIAQLYNNWCSFAEIKGNRLAGSIKAFGQMMKAKGFAPEQLRINGKNCKCYNNVALIGKASGHAY